MARKKTPEPEAPPPPEPEEKKPDPFVGLLQATIEEMLQQKEPVVAYKDRVSLVANAIKFLQVKHKIEGAEDGGSIWDETE